MILIIDNYDSFTYNLVHLVAEATDEYNVVRNDEIDLQQARALDPKGILISPGPGRPHEAGVSELLIREMGPDTPVLGVCLGHQAIGEVFGAKVTHAPSLMHGKTSKIFHDGKSVFRDIPSGFTATRYHSLILEKESIPDELEITANTSDGVVMGIRHKSHPLEGIQFHPESILTDVGARIINNWLSIIGETAGRKKVSG